MSFTQGCFRKSAVNAGMARTALVLAETAGAKSCDRMSICDALSSADLAMQRGEYKYAIPALQKVISCAGSMTDTQSK